MWCQAPVVGAVALTRTVPLFDVTVSPWPAVIPTFTALLVPFRATMVCVVAVEVMFAQKAMVCATLVAGRLLVPSKP